MSLTLTLASIREQSPCTSGWRTLLKHLSENFPEEQEFSLSVVLESNGWRDAVWCLRAVKPEEVKQIPSLAADIAESVLDVFERKYPEDTRPRIAISTVRAWVNGEYITGVKLREVAGAANDAAYTANAAYAANAAVYAAYAAYTAEYDAALAAAYAAYAAYDANDAAFAAANANAAANAASYAAYAANIYKIILKYC